MPSDPPAGPPGPGIDYVGVNHLGDETSPYLLQHQYNPVHWYAWGPAAFEAARALDRPIFISIGYSTCYWCHVMERESFENEEIAAYLNEHFISIKIDREERPDVDDIYMAAVQLFTGRGGWPMTVFLEPESLAPFLGGTYFPRPGFRSLLEQVVHYWNNERDAFMQQAEQVARGVEQRLGIAAQAQPLSAAEVDRAVSQLLASYDRTNAGFGGAPKFPIPQNLDFLMTAAWEHEPMRDATRHTLDRMAMGGMYDQVGGGFHRYSTDAIWLVPHFEKMVYDNGQLASTYARAYELTFDPYYAEIVRETLDYVLREMTSEDGAFYSAQDAEVNHREGENYLWTPEQVTAALTDAGMGDDVAFALQVYGLDRGTNFRDPHHPEDPPNNVLFLPDRPEVLAASLGITADEFNERLVRVNEALLAVRDQRDQPGLDDKVLVAWNGIMIAGMADGGQVLAEDRYVEAGVAAATWILENMSTDDGGLYRTARAGQVKIDAFLEDYAFLVHGLLALNRATGDQSWLREAERLVTIAKERFWDDVGGGFFDTLPDQADLFVRTKSYYDGAVPCGNSMMISNLITLYTLTNDDAWLADARSTLDGVSAYVTRQPTGAILATLGLQRLLAIEPVAAATTPTVVQRGPVTISIGQERVEISDGAPASVVVTISIATGFHINSHQPGIDFLIPLQFSITGASGVMAIIEYPPGETFDGPEGSMNVHAGTVEIPVQIVKTGPVTGRPQLTVEYQVCNDQVCLQPETEPLPLRIIAN